MKSKIIILADMLISRLERQELKCPFVYKPDPQGYWYEVNAPILIRTLKTIANNNDQENLNGYMAKIKFEGTQKAVPISHFFISSDVFHKLCIRSNISPPELTFLPDRPDNNDGKDGNSDSIGAETTNTDILSEFHNIDDLRFNEIKITVDPEKLMLRIRARNIGAMVPFYALNLTQKNGVTLNKQGETFLDIAKKNFRLDSSGSETALNRLSKVLRDAFDTSDPPFEKGTPKFAVSIPKENEAKREAAKRTVSYNDNIKAGNGHNMTADDFLKEHDPNYDPNDPLYSNEF
ncbi:MAG: hypothetical protein HQL47_05170 [Gammaproteobacteria bacterium]|nr:hypothetical protein [Gammaproteobacteria bacterium]